MGHNEPVLAQFTTESYDVVMKPSLNTPSIAMKVP
jgi:hypothetical protein